MNIIKLSGDSNLLIYINNIEIGLLDENQDYFIVKILNETEFFLKIYPIQTTQETCISYVAKLTYINNNWVTNNPNLCVTKYPNGYYKIIIKKQCVCNYNSTTIDYKDNTNTLSVLCSYPQQLLFKNNMHSTTFTLNYNIKKPLFSVLYQYYALNAQYNNKQYLLLLDKSGKKQLEVIADKIETTNNDVVLLDYMNDINQHGYITKYSIDNNEIKFDTSYSVYLNSTPNEPINKYSIYWSFIEVLNIGNIKLARTYLADDLNNLLDDEHLLGYFGNYSEIETNWIDNQQFSVFVIDSNYPKTAKRFTFELQDDKIINIINDD